MIVLEGQPALSPFRRERLESRLQSLVPGLRVTGAWFTYWVEPEPGQSPDAATLHRILEAHGAPVAWACPAAALALAPSAGGSAARQACQQQQVAQKRRIKKNRKTPRG